MRLRLSIVILLLIATGASFAGGLFDESCAMLSLEKSNNSADVTLGFSLAKVNGSNVRYEDFFVGVTERFSANGKPRLIPCFLIASIESSEKSIYRKSFHDKSKDTDDDDDIDSGRGNVPESLDLKTYLAPAIMDSKSASEFNFKLDWVKFVCGLGLNYHRTESISCIPRWSFYTYVGGSITSYRIDAQNLPNLAEFDNTNKYGPCAVVGAKMPVIISYKLKIAPHTEYKYMFGSGQTKFFSAGLYGHYAFELPFFKYSLGLITLDYDYNQIQIKSGSTFKKDDCSSVKLGFIVPIGHLK